MWKQAVISHLMQREEEQNVKQLWMNHRKIDEFGLIVPYAKQRQFNISECVSSLENLLAKTQAEGLQIHYAQQTNFKDWLPAQVETITYEGYLVGRCPKTNFDKCKNTKRGEVHVEYKILRVDQEQAGCAFPFLLLFALRIETFPCATCACDHLFRMFKSSFEAVRTEFIMEVKNKVQFMRKYPKYLFQPHNFISKREHGLTPFLRLKYEDYEAAEYFEMAEQILINCLRMHCLRENFDFQAIRLDEYFKLMGQSEQGKAQFQTQFNSHDLPVKTKYICCKCKQRVIWTTKSKVSFKYTILKLGRTYCLPDKAILDQQPQLAQHCRQKLQNQGSSKRLTNRSYLESSYGLDCNKLDKSLIRQIEQEQELRALMQKIGSWHLQASEYSYPQLVVVSIRVPQMSCTGCLKKKDGLIYMSYLINLINSTLIPEISRKARQFCKKKYAVKTP